MLATPEHHPAEGTGRSTAVIADTLKVFLTGPIRGYVAENEAAESSGPDICRFSAIVAFRHSGSLRLDREFPVLGRTLDAFSDRR